MIDNPRADKPNKHEFNQACLALLEIVLDGHYKTFDQKEKAALNQVQLWLRQNYLS